MTAVLFMMRIITHIQDLAYQIIVSLYVRMDKHGEGEFRNSAWSSQLRNSVSTKVMLPRMSKVWHSWICRGVCTSPQSQKLELERELYPMQELSESAVSRSQPVDHDTLGRSYPEGVLLARQGMNAFHQSVHSRRDVGETPGASTYTPF